MYLEKINWLKKVSESFHSNSFSQNSKFEKKNGLIIFLSCFIFCCFGILSINFVDDNSITNIYKSTLGVAYAAAPGKIIKLYIKRGYTLLCKGIFPLGDELSIVKKETPLNIPLNGVEFAIYNTEWRYFDFPAIDWIYPSRLIAERGTNKKIAFLQENLGSAFQAIPYFKEKATLATNYSLLFPFLKTQGKPLKWKRKFSDGKTRIIHPKDNWLCLRPNVFGKIRNGEIDKKLNIPSLNPEEVLPVAFYVFTNLCNWRTGEWNIEKTRWLVSRQYAFAYGIYIPPEKIKIQGKGLRTRFIINQIPSLDLVTIPNKKGKTEIVSIVNQKKELLFWTSFDPTQSVFIPFSYLWKMDDEKDKIYLAGGTLITNMREIKEELQQIKNDWKPLRFDNENLQRYVVNTPRFRELSDRLIAQKTREDGIATLVDYTNIALPYVSDHRADKNRNYNGPVEIPYPPTLAMMNRGGDCEDHAILMASLFLSSSLPNSEEVGLAVLSYRRNHEGHVMPLIPLIGKLQLDPFPNYVVFNNIPYAFIEATGYGYNKLHQTLPTRNGYQPLWAEFIKVDKKRVVREIGFNQFLYALK